MKALLILVSGLPCTGKTTLARKIAEELSLPLISRDDIKESLFDSLGWKDRQWSKQLGIASYKLLYYFIESQINVGNSLIVESNFMPKFDTPKFMELKAKFAFNLLQIHCKADTLVLLGRFQNRSESDERRPGHVDRLNYEEFKMTLTNGGYDPLSLGGRVVKIDTTDFAKIDYQGLFNSLMSTRFEP